MNDLKIWMHQNRIDYEKRIADQKKEHEEGLKSGKLWDPDIPGSWEKHREWSQAEADRLITNFLAEGKSKDEIMDKLQAMGFYLEAKNNKLLYSI